MFDVAVVGAGAAGIAAGRRLGEAGARCILLEAGLQPGGRARTDMHTLGVPIDLGCHWLHSPASNPLRPLADALGVRYRDRAMEERLLRDGRSLPAIALQACERYLEACFETVSAAQADVPVASLFSEPGPWHPVFDAVFAAKQGVAPRDASAIDFARYVWEGDDLPVVDGLGTLVLRLAEGLPLRLGVVVESIAWGARAGVRLHTGVGVIDARAALITVSTGVLAEGRPRFEPALPGWKQRAIADLPMGHCNKLALAFDGDLLGDCEEVLLLPLRGGEESVELVVRSGGASEVVMLVSGAFGQALSAAGEAAMADYALERVLEVTGSAVRRQLRGRRLHADWDGEPFIRGCYAAARPGGAHRRVELALPLAGSLFFAGEATHECFMGDVHGAWLSGERAADEALAALGHARPAVPPDD